MHYFSLSLFFIFAEYEIELLMWTLVSFNYEKIISLSMINIFL